MPSPHFTGREDLLEALHEARSDARPVMLTQVLCGLGGIGKTQIALEYAYRYGGTYGLVWWVRAEEPETLASDYAALAEALHLSEQTAQDQTTTIAAVRRWLERHDGWLMILDDAPEPAAVYAYLPRSTHGHIVITSRHFGWGGTAKALIVPVLPRQEAVKLLLEVTQQSDVEKAEVIAETLGDLPLALAQAAAYIEANGLSLFAYSERLKTQLEALLYRGKGSLDYPGTVATTWKMAFDALQETQPAAIGFLKLCAFFAPDDIPYALLRDNTPVLPEPLAEVAPDDFQWDDAILALRHYALIETGEETLAVHRLVQAITRDWLPVDERTQWAGVAVKLIANVLSASGLPVEPRVWPTYACYLPHGASVVSHVNDTDPIAADTAFLLNRMGAYLDARAQFEEAKPHYERALTIYKQVLGPEHSNTATSLNNLGYLVQAQGNLAAAKPYYEQALAIRIQVL